MTATTTDTNTVRFFYNGVKPGGVKGAKLVRANPMLQLSFKTHGDRVVPTQVTWYAKDYRAEWPDAMRAVGVENNSDSSTDYFEEDRIRVMAGHDLFVPSVMAWLEDCRRDAARQEKRGNADQAAVIRSKCSRLAIDALAEHHEIVRERIRAAN